MTNDLTHGHWNLILSSMVSHTADKHPAWIQKETRSRKTTLLSLMSWYGLVCPDVFLLPCPVQVTPEQHILKNYFKHHEVFHLSEIFYRIWNKNLLRVSAQSHWLMATSCIYPCIQHRLQGPHSIKTGSDNSSSSWNFTRELTHCSLFVPGSSDLPQPR